MAYVNGRYAAIDIGTVTCRMLVADVEDGKVLDVAKQYAITDLGEGVDKTGRLSSEAMGRVALTVERYLNELKRYDTPETPVRKIITMATSAARDASNSGEFMALLRDLGLELSVIPGEHEAKLSFIGASSDFEGERLLVVDIGGGSTEIIAGRAGQTPLASHSFNVGCRRVTERFFEVDPPSHGELATARMWIHEEFGQFFDDLREGGFACDRLVAVAGTATSVVSVREAMEVYDSDRVHLTEVSLRQLQAIQENLAQMPLDERKSVVGLDPNRAGVIVAGLIILEEVLGLARVTGYTVSESDILHGMILEAASR